MDQAEATSRAKAYAAEHLPDIEEPDRPWIASRYQQCWRMVPGGADLEWYFGPCLVVLDDGRIFKDSASLPPDDMMARYEELARSGPESEEAPEGQ